ncbi:MAG: superoxide dismutase family protein [Legionellaceae bacterium]|nr:superoxide dismutase family protein [Legionellaceae bacterium]
MLKKTIKKIILTGFLSGFVITSHAAQKTVMIVTTGAQKSIGQVILRDNPNGLIIIPNLEGLPPGLHGFHIHSHANCSDNGMAAGGHFDPKNTKSHQGPEGNGHLGDLQALHVDKNGIANITTIAPRLKLSDLKNLTLMIHQGGDTYSDTPPLGGGGVRIACGVIN